jgi:hypothetical protein
MVYLKGWGIGSAKKRRDREKYRRAAIENPPSGGRGRRSEGFLGCAVCGRQGAETGGKRDVETMRAMVLTIP